MPAVLSYPGVYIEEVPSGVRTITGVATSVTAFIGRAPRGPLDSDAKSPVRVTSYADYERQFGGLANDCPMSFAVYHFFANGGAEALIIRVVNGANTAQTPSAPAAALFSAANPGAWGNDLRLRVDHDIDAEIAAANPSNTLFNLAVKDLGTEAVESFRNLSITAGHPRNATQVLAEQSRLLRGAASFGARPAANVAAPPGTPDPFRHASATTLDGGTDGSAIGETQVSSGVGLRAAKRGLYALEKADLFNLLVVPPFSPTADVANGTWSAAVAYCIERRAMLLVDPPFHASGWNAASDVTNSAITGVVARSHNAALFFPRLLAPNPLRESRSEPFAPAGAVAGVIARTDAQRGVWKSPAGLDATLNGVLAPAVPLTDLEQGGINPLGVNCIRNFPAAGNVVWGARTMRGADALASEWKYLAVRRTALFIEESLYRGTQWVVFEPNDEPLWAQIRMNLGAFMNNLFRQGAFQGASPREAYFVRCDSETTTQNDIDLGIVNIVVGFAPLKPAEFVVIKLQQIAGQAAA
jgi:phage tail sheath protein FI